MKRTSPMESKLWLLPCILALIGAGFYFLASGWTWSLYDEISWLTIYQRTHSWVDFTRNDWISNGRFRPFSAIYVLGKYKIFDQGAALMHRVRYLEFTALVILFGVTLRRFGASFFAVAAGVAFLLKSPPALEQVRWMTLSELPALVFLLTGLLVRPQVLKYFLLVLAAFTKEPFSLFLALPALLERRFKDAFAAFAITAVHWVFLFANRRAYTANYKPFSWAGPAGREILKGSALDLPLLILTALLVLLALWKSRVLLKTIWQPLIFNIFGAAYFLLVLPKAWGYSYILAPGVVLFSLGFGLFVHQAKQPLLVGVLTLFIFTAPFRLIWNVNKLQYQSAERARTIEVLPYFKGRLATNCMIDGAGLGFAADRRADEEPCLNSSVHECCLRADLVLLGNECGETAALVKGAREKGLVPVYRNALWEMYRCR